MPRFLAIDFETNGLVGDDVLPHGAFPTAVSVTAYDPGIDRVQHLFTSYIHGAETFSEWVQEKGTFTLEVLYDSPPLPVVLQKLADLWREGDVLATHNAKFDLETVLRKVAPEDHPFLTAPRLCTMSQGWCPGYNKPWLAHLCQELDVPYIFRLAHNSRYDSEAVAKCVQVAHTRGLRIKTMRVSRC